MGGADEASEAQRLRGSEALTRSTLLELFFDLVFVFALTQLSATLAAHLTWAGAFQVLLLALTLWRVWILTVSTGDVYDLHHPAFILMLIAAMFGTLVMACVLPSAFQRSGLVFAGTNLAVQLGRAAVLFLALRPHPRDTRPIRLVFWFGASTPPWIVGALTHGTTRALLWTLAVVLEYLGSQLHWYTPGLGRSPQSDWPFSPEHQAERFRQIIIIVIGEAVLTMGSTYVTTSGGVATGRIGALTVTFATTAVLWRIYTYQSGERMVSYLAAGPDRWVPAHRLDWCHLVMVFSIMITSVGFEITIAHPYAHPRWSWVAVIAGGPALFLAGRTVFGYLVFGYVSAPRPIAIAVLGGLTPVLVRVPPLLASVVVGPVLLGLLILVPDLRIGRSRREGARPLGR
ncbi:low temperature requirement protein A [Rugosimonospora africana]|uniref:Membrane protein n=1 Tax=Rugosimonospora africana TaxID=556532 RepID=A0A8J3R430_9ACTN|nr:low temperature requirement protein A [Rugosimonospora africana]GIH19686.1 membrane protein [Rugosimonospora africana]